MRRCWSSTRSRLTPQKIHPREPALPRSHQKSRPTWQRRTRSSLFPARATYPPETAQTRLRHHERPPPRETKKPPEAGFFFFLRAPDTRDANTSLAIRFPHSVASARARAVHSTGCLLTRPWPALSFRRDIATRWRSYRERCLGLFTQGKCPFSECARISFDGHSRARAQIHQSSLAYQFALWVCKFAGDCWSFLRKSKSLYVLLPAFFLSERGFGFVLCFFLCYRESYVLGDLCGWCWGIDLFVAFGSRGELLRECGVINMWHYSWIR